MSSLQSQTPLPPPTPAEIQYEAAARFEGFSVSELRTAFAAVADPADWRRPWKARVRRADAARLAAACRYFHADDPVGTLLEDGQIELAGGGRRTWPDAGPVE